MKKILLLVVVALLLTAGMAAAADETSWLTIGGDYRFRFDSLKGTVGNFNQFVPPPIGPLVVPTTGYTVRDNSFMTNRFGINIKADPMEDVVVKARLVMYKVWGHETSTPFMGNFFADRFGGTNDGTSTHAPEDNTLRVDYAYATVNNIFDAPLWFSIGRRPSTGGIPSNLRANQEKIGTAGIPALLVDYAFDGATIGFAPDIAALPGFYGKLCYGRGFSEGFDHVGNAKDSRKNVEFYGLNVVPFDTDKLHVEVQYDLGKNIFDAPSDGGVTTNLGNIHWLGGVVTAKVANLNVFASAAASKTDPNGNTNPFGAGLEWDSLHAKESHMGNAIYIGGRYDMGRTKVGAEYNRGSKYWISMVPASDDVWTGKLGTRGSVYEVYVIQELNRKPISKKGKAFVKLGYQYYKFDYTSSNNWVGSPDDIGTANPQFLAPVKDAQDLYATFEVQF